MWPQIRSFFSLPCAQRKVMFVLCLVAGVLAVVVARWDWVFPLARPTFSYTLVPLPGPSRSANPSAHALESVFFDINRVRLEELSTVGGMPVWVWEKILSFRDQLGAFHSLDQLEDVGFKPHFVPKVRVYFRMVTRPRCKTFYVNVDDYASLRHNPYLTAAVLQYVFSLRQKGLFLGALADLAPVMDAQKRRRAAPYLSFAADK